MSSTSNRGSLRDRVAAQRQGDEPGAEVVKARSLEDQIKRMAPEFNLALPKGKEATQLVRDAITCLRKIKNLDACDAPSLLGSLMTCAQLGLIWTAHIGVDRLLGFGLKYPTQFHDTHIQRL